MQVDGMISCSLHTHTHNVKKEGGGIRKKKGGIVSRFPTSINRPPVGTKSIYHRLLYTTLHYTDALQCTALHCIYDVIDFEKETLI